MRIILILCCSFFILSTSEASPWVLQKRVATVLNTVDLFADSSYFGNSLTRLSEGELLEILEESVLEHEDDAQNQKFKWYKVKSYSGQEGWVFGDGLAVMLEENMIVDGLRPFHKIKQQFDNGFENSIMWVAGMHGRDNFHDNDFLNPEYHELYVVITNDRGRSVHINYESQSAMGRTMLEQFQLLDVTGDKTLDILLLTQNIDASSDLRNKTFEIFSLQSGTLRKVLNERMTLTYEGDLASPAMYKYVEVSDGSIRIEYVDYVKCERYSQSYTFPSESKTQERCLEFITYTYAWDQRKKQFEVFYKKNKTPLSGVVSRRKLFLYEKPSKLAKKIVELTPNEPFVIIKHYEKVFLQNGTKKLMPYLYVQAQSGQQGYISGNAVYFLNLEHGDLLRNFYTKPPLSKTELKTDKQFLKIIRKGEQWSSSKGN